MMQLVLTLLVVGIAITYVVTYVVKHHLTAKHDCDGCAVKKMMENK